jgi:hypothetical protein
MLICGMVLRVVTLGMMAGVASATPLNSFSR